jgi:hypothetical protein
MSKPPPQVELTFEQKVYEYIKKVVITTMGEEYAFNFIKRQAN